MNASFCLCKSALLIILFLALAHFGFGKKNKACYLFILLNNSVKENRDSSEWTLFLLFSPCYLNCEEMSIFLDQSRYFFFFSLCSRKIVINFYSTYTIGAYCVNKRMQECYDQF